MSGLTVALVAEESAGTQALRLLVERGHHVAAVLASPPGARPGASTWAAAEGLGIPAIAAERVRDDDFADDLRAAGVDLLLNVHSLYLIADAVLSAPAIGAFNLHPGPLPEFAGLNTPCWALYEGVTSFGVTLHWMVPQVDGGPIAYEDRFPVSDGMTGIELYGVCSRRGLHLLDRLLQEAVRSPHEIPRRAQDPERRRYYRGHPVEGGSLSWHMSAEQIARYVRAAYFGPFPGPWPRPIVTLEGEPVRIDAARRTGRPCNAPIGTIEGDSEGDVVCVATADEWLEVEVTRQVRKAQEPSHS